MNSVIVVTPSAPLVSVADAKLWSPVLAGDDDGRIAALLACAQAALDPPSWLGSTLGEAVLEVRWPGLPRFGPVRLPYGPATEVVSVAYDDPDGVEQTVDPFIYRLFGAGTVRAELGLRHRQSWPFVACGNDAVRVRYKAGYPINDPHLIPAKHAIVLSAVQLRSLSTDDLALRSVDVDGVESRTFTVSDAAEKLVRNAVENLLSGYRVWAV
ncbi:hypothetical protein GCM10008171_32880 [Methylopila jiangsuensis]|uniref:Phage gp6-like head-tail connector protein n=1 Tax=Methylopila jiangsuensis TaxID=586230 RepID=A0A9W6JLR7_9HYPH|nr:hypothetical protein [Methylopila jiangsuensis]MDR6284577.1 hypothetical protein [Methylopila jiangsuensis]GLK78034.1 hypothetical protein GCM10008171_32880 [Methylopila jiangsuensis]